MDTVPFQMTGGGVTRLESLDIVGWAVLWSRRSYSAATAGASGARSRFGRMLSAQAISQFSRKRVSVVPEINSPGSRQRYSSMKLTVASDALRTIRYLGLAGQSEALGRERAERLLRILEDD